MVTFAILILGGILIALKKIRFATMPLFILLLILPSTIVQIYKAQDVESEKLPLAGTSFAALNGSMGIKQNALDLITANDILKHFRGISTQIGIGTVIEVTSKIEQLSDKGHDTIRTYTKILVRLPLSDSIKSEQIIFARYFGGKVGERGVSVDALWAYGPNDTVIVPSQFSLKEGMSILFFVDGNTTELRGYIPYSLPTTTNNSLSLKLLSETQPSTTVAEADGYGFSWSDGLHRDWNNLPVVYNIDPDGTGDIAGTTNEFNAIKAGFSTWEDLRFSGIDFTYNSTSYDYDTQSDFYDYDWINVVGWATFGTDPGYIGACINWYNGVHLTESDIHLNDYKTFSIGASAGAYDVQSIVTHEVGHTLRLHDLYNVGNVAQTMYHFTGTNSIALRSLEWGDENGAHYVYPVHNDANQGGDGSNTFSGASSVIKNTAYYGRLCDLPTPDHTLDTQDYFKIYAGSTSRLAFVLHPPSNADFDLELYNPSGQLVAYSRTRTNGGSETITRDPMGVTGYWRIRIYRYSTGGQGGNGQYYFRISDIPLKYR